MDIMHNYLSDRRVVIGFSVVQLMYFLVLFLFVTFSGEDTFFSLLKIHLKPFSLLASYLIQCG